MAPCQPLKPWGTLNHGAQSISEAMKSTQWATATVKTKSKTRDNFSGFHLVDIIILLCMRDIASRYQMHFLLWVLAFKKHFLRER